MWADNETPIDLLGFDYLVDQLEVVLTDRRLRPITVGALGDWGSGKTSLMFMTADRLRQRESYSVVSFSPWRYESTAEVKAELMAAVLRGLARWVDDHAGDGEEAQKSVAAVKENLAHLLRLSRKLAARSAPILTGAGATALGVPPQLGIVVGQLIGDAIAPVENDDNVQEDDPVEFASATEFREELRNVMATIDGLEALIVLIDDVDRCLPPTIIETFETIRLFLHVRDTAFVIAAHPQIVEAAVAHRYAGNREGDANLGRDYLEKIIHLPVVVPPLSRPEVESYINLLYCELHTEEQTFAALRKLAVSRRSSEPLGVAMNYGIAAQVFDEGKVPDDLAAAFELANKIGPLLGEGLRGNPRQVKRFLNAFRLRLITAEKRKTTLDPAILAKLMILELDRKDFQQLFEWQIAQDGNPAELRDAEAFIREDKESKTMSADAKAWAGRPAVARWLALDPPLAGTALGTYFFYSRDQLSPVAGGARLTGAQQDVLARLQLDIGAQRAAAVAEAVSMGALDRMAIYRALLDRARRDPQTSAMRSALDIAVAAEDVVADFAAALSAIPPNSVPTPLPLQIIVGFSKAPPAAVDAALDEWHSHGGKRIRAAVEQARS